MITINLTTLCECKSQYYCVDLTIWTKSKKVIEIKKKPLVRKDSKYVLQLKNYYILFKLEYKIYDNNELVINDVVLSKNKNNITVNEIYEPSHICNSDNYYLNFNKNFDSSNHLYLSYNVNEIQETLFMYLKCITEKKKHFYLIFKINQVHNHIIFLKRWNNIDIQIEKGIIINEDRTYNSNLSHIQFNSSFEINFKENKQISDEIYNFKIENPSVDKNKNITVLFRFFHPLILELIESAKKEIIIAMYNIEDIKIANALIKAYKNGVKVFVLTSYKMIYKRHDKQLDSYKLLIDNNIPLYTKIHPNREEKHIHSSMHTKICVIDDHTSITGSVNWEYHSCNNNEEVMTVFNNNVSIAQYYKEMIRNFILPSSASIDLPKWIDIYDTQRDRIIFINKICEILKTVKKGDTIYMAMFILMDFQLEWNLSIEEQLETTKKEQYSVIDELRMCTERGVNLNIIVEKNTNDDVFGQYYQEKIVPNRFVDYIQENWKNTNIWRIKTHRGNNMYSAIHHKFCIINEYSIYGSANWWSVSFDSDDDIVILEDEIIAKQYIDEWYRLISPTFTINDVPKQLEEYELIQSIFVEILYQNDVFKEKEMEFDKNLNEYYCEILFDYSSFNELKKILEHPIVYRYKIITLNKNNNEIQTDYDIMRTKSFSYYKSTDHWGQKSVNDMINDNIVVL